jgi:hypothetical protein
MSENKVRVKGRAYNSKAGATVQAKDGKIYFIINITEWPKKYYEKIVIVKGKLSVVYDTCKTDKLERQRVAIKRNIDSAKFRVAFFGLIPKLPEE